MNKLFKISKTSLLTPLIICTLLATQSNTLSAAVAPAEEMSIQRERDSAMDAAMAAIDPSLINPLDQPIEGVVGQDDGIWVEREVERLRAARKRQFKYLTDSHVRSVINAETILAKGDFLQQRQKNLGSIIERAVSVYVPAQIERERIQLAKFRIAKAIRDLFPEAKLTADIKNGVLSGTSFISDTWRMAFRQPLFRGGVLWNTLLLEFSNLEIAKRTYDQALSDLLSDVSEAYFEYERAQNVLHEQTLLFEIVTEQKKISDKKMKAKLISEIEELNTDSLYSQAQYDMENAEQEMAVALLELKKYLKLDDADEIGIRPLYELETFKIEDLGRTAQLPIPSGGGELGTELEQLIDLTYQNRSDLQVEASKLKASQLAYRIAIGRRLPQLDLLFEFGELAEAFLANLPTKDGPNHRHEFRIGMEMTWPVAGNTVNYTYDHDQRAPSVSQFLSGSGTRTRSNSFSVGFLDDMEQFTSMTEAKISTLEQVVELEQTEREAIREVKEAYFNFNKSMIQVESAFKRMGYRERLAVLAKHRMGQNEVQISEYLQSEMDLAEEKGLFYQALSDFFLSKAQLNRALGIRDYLPIDVVN